MSVVKQIITVQYSGDRKVRLILESQDTECAQLPEWNFGRVVEDIIELEGAWEAKPQQLRMIARNHWCLTTQPLVDLQAFGEIWKARNTWVPVEMLRPRS